MIGPRPTRAVLLALAFLGLSAAAGFAHPQLERGPAPAAMIQPGPAMAPRGPLETRTVKTYLPAKAGEPSGVGTSVFQSLLRFYRKVISPVDGDRCVMAPTCSLYSHQALETHGVLLGIALTAERLLHEGDEIGRAPTIVEHGETLHVDPLEGNTYWLWEWLK